MRPVFGMLLIGGGTFLLIALFNGWIQLPGVSGTTGGGLGGFIQQQLNPSTPPSLQQGVQPQPGNKCPAGMQYNPDTGKCQNIYHR